VRSPGHTESLALLCDLPAGQEAELLHLLTCDSCRGRVVDGLRAVYEDDTAEVILSYEAIRSALPDLLPGAAVRLEAGESQEIRALLRVQPEEAPDWIDGDLSEDVLLHLIAEARRLTAEEPEEALALCSAVPIVARRLYPAVLESLEDLDLWRARADICRGEALRHLGRFAQAQEAYQIASGHLSLYPWVTAAGAELCRSEGILRWELGELDIAEALLRHSARVFGELALPEEESASRSLLGLVLSERNLSGRAARVLEVGRRHLDEEAWPGLAFQARLGLAFELARLGQSEKARGLLEVSYEAGDARVDWLQGRVRAQLGEAEAAERQLDGARVWLLAEEQMEHAVLCSFDLAVLLIEMGRGGEVDSLMEDLAVRFSGNAAVEEILIWGRQAAGAGAFRRPLTAEQWASADAFVRRAVRLGGGYVLLPLP
jgi:tetratricopeptide (TPR) repeat protein